jgi:hypothetical protein
VQTYATLLTAARSSGLGFILWLRLLLGRLRLGFLLGRLGLLLLLRRRWF